MFSSWIVNEFLNELWITLEFCWSIYHFARFRRADSFVKKLKEMQQKENEETAALEKMVHMVEKNLELTTVRFKRNDCGNMYSVYIIVLYMTFRWFYPTKSNHSSPAEKNSNSEKLHVISYTTVHVPTIIIPYITVLVLVRAVFQNSGRFRMLNQSSTDRVVGVIFWDFRVQCALVFGEATSVYYIWVYPSQILNQWRRDINWTRIFLIIFESWIHQCILLRFFLVRFVLTKKNQITSVDDFKCNN